MNGSNGPGMHPPRSPELEAAAQALREESPEWRRVAPPSEAPLPNAFAPQTKANLPSRVVVPTLPLPARFQKRAGRAATLPANNRRWEGSSRAPATSRLRRASNALWSRRDLLQARAASSGIRPALLWTMLLLLLLWCIGTTVLLVRLARDVTRVEKTFELIEAPATAEDEGVRKLLDKFNAGGQAVKRRLGKVPLISAAYIVLAPHVGWVYALVAPHLGPLRFIGTRAFAACRLIMPALRRLKPLFKVLERVKPLLLLVEIRAKARMLFSEWAAKGQTAV